MESRWGEGLVAGHTTFRQHERRPTILLMSLCQLRLLRWGAHVGGLQALGKLVDCPQGVPI